jgi:DNA replication and repair protein RecF
MLSLKNISLYQFKNYQERSFTFNRDIIAVCGPNGTGKTNLLDAIHYLCFTKSYFSRQDILHVRTGNMGFRIDGEFMLDEKPLKTVCLLRETGKKEFTVNDLTYEKLSRHFGRFPCLVIAPDDAELITGESKSRRNFMDNVLSQVNEDYLAQLIRYNKILMQRNAALKNFAEEGRTDTALLDLYNRQLSAPGHKIFLARQDFFRELFQLVNDLYRRICGQKEMPELTYETELQHASFEDLFSINKTKDLVLQRTVSGIHRDDIRIKFGGQAFRNIASQGQRKSLLFALKLAAFDYIKTHKGFSPLLLLDDVLEKLDEGRIHYLLQIICEENKGQVFITDTNRQRLCEHLDRHTRDYGVLEL